MSSFCLQLSTTIHGWFSMKCWRNWWHIIMCILKLVFLFQTKEADLLDLSLRLQDAEELSEGLRKELKSSQADREAQVHIRAGVDFIKVGRKAWIIEKALSICALCLRPTFWKAFYWHKSSAQGRMAQKKFMKLTPVQSITFYLGSRYKDCVFCFVLLIIYFILLNRLSVLSNWFLRK